MMNAIVTQPITLRHTDADITR